MSLSPLLNGTQMYINNKYTQTNEMAAEKTVSTLAL